MEGHEGHSQNCPASIAHHMKKTNTVGLMWAVPRVLAMIGVLSISYGDECDEPLYLWILVLCIQDICVCTVAKFPS